MTKYRTIVALVAIVAATVTFRSRLFSDRSIDVIRGETLVVDGQTRSFRLVVPKTLPAKCPLLFAFHRSGDSAEGMAAYSDLDRLAGRYGFVLAYPETLNPTWSSVDAGSQSTDLLYFDMLLDLLNRRYPIDSRRVYVTGMSDGASFTQLLTNARSSKITAAVACSGAAPDGLNIRHDSIPLLLIVGSDDRIADSVKRDFLRYKNSGIG